MALSKIKTNSLSDDAVTAAKIATGTIVAADLAANSVDSSELVDGSVDFSHMSVNSINSDQYVDGSIDTVHIAELQVTTAKIAADAITAAKIADDAINSEHYTDGSIDTAHIANLQITTALIAADAITGAKVADDAIDSEHYTDGSIDTAHIADNQVTLAKMAGLARGKIIYGDASGDPAALTVGSNGQVLKSDGTDISWGASPASISSYTNATNNRVITSVDSSTVNGEANLTFDGSTLAVTGAATVSTTLGVTGNATFSGGATLSEGTLSDASTISWDAATDPVAKVTLGANRTLGSASNGATGQFISLLVIQDGTGSRTLSWNAAYEFKEDTAPTLTTTASKGDLFVFRYNGSKWLEVGRNQALTLS